MTNVRTIGVIGLGKMGLPIAENLLGRGFDVVGYRRSTECPELEAAGGAVAASPAELAASCEVIVSILPTADDVEHVICGPEGTLSTLRPGAVHLEMSTIPVLRKLGLMRQLERAGATMLDCPISGSPGMVGPRLATVFASGAAEAIDRVADVLDAISGPWVRTGDFGTGTHLKYISSMLVATHTVAAAEAIVLARRDNLDLDMVQHTLETSIAGSALLERRGPLMAHRSWLPAPGPVATLHEILDQVEVHLRDLGERRPVFEAAKAVFDQAMADGWGELDIASVHDQISTEDALAQGVTE
ncbi:NAD(P)-dependent oxidoreductase [Nocardia sp. NPDC046763]|uniref:NAD(P)-dependent oxidoreductase n=1 Tax=Nocardia sp. NPDC046763 TaxID=3155256 RepID=UPI0033D064CF